MDFFAPQYSLLAVIAAAVGGWIAGRVAAVRADPRYAEQRKRAEQAEKFELDAAIARLPADTRKNAQAALTRGYKIEAVKIVRDDTGLGLKEAKDIVDRLERDTA